MKAVFPFSFLIVLGTAVLLDPTTASAQTRPVAAGQARPTTTQVSRPAATTSVRRSPIAVVDISYIFKNHDGFKTAMDGMKKEVEAYEEHLPRQQNAC